jgi:uncharacterized protein
VNTSASEPAARVAALTVYPLKSAAGIGVDTMPLDDFGAVGDRRWLLVDGEGRAITARDCHALLRITPRFATADRNGALLLDAPAHSTLTAVVPDAGALTRPVHVWNDTVQASDVGDDAADWCSSVIGRSCRLVHLDDDAIRPLQPKYAGSLPHEGRRVAFSDGAPLLVLGLPSVEALNARLLEQGDEARLSPRRFRANVWLEQCAPHAEDRWGEVQVGDVTLGMGSLCLRCVLTTVDPDTLGHGQQPLRVFAEYRRAPDGVVFGVNATHAQHGALRVGDAVVVHRWRD